MPSELKLVMPDPTGLLEAVGGLIGSAAKDYCIADRESHAVALERIKKLTATEKEIDLLFEKSRKAAKAMHETVLETRDGIKAPYKAARALYEAKDAEWRELQARVAREEQERRLALVRAQEEERKLADAQAAQDSGDMEEAEAILEEPVLVPAPYVEPAVAEVKGSYLKVTKTAEVVSLALLVAWVGDQVAKGDPSALRYVEACQAELNRAVAKGITLPGVRVVITEKRVTRTS